MQSLGITSQLKGLKIGQSVVFPMLKQDSISTTIYRLRAQKYAFVKDRDLEKEIITVTRKKWKRQ